MEADLNLEQGPVWGEYTCDNQTLLQLQGGNVSRSPDDYRAQQIDFINSNAFTFRH
ncbi:hypothetical protein C8R43DRAFT_1127122 [Mycena crocata]|nr:hypothetical protein C8R43DRAFT_1127122 [Mycena crocata]